MAYRIDYDHKDQYYRVYKDEVFLNLFMTEWGAKRAIKRDKKIRAKLNGSTTETVYTEEG